MASTNFRYEVKLREFHHSKIESGLLYAYQISFGSGLFSEKTFFVKAKVQGEVKFVESIKLSIHHQQYAFPSIQLFLFVKNQFETEHRLKPFAVSLRMPNQREELKTIQIGDSDDMMARAAISIIKITNQTFQDEKMQIITPPFQSFDLGKITSLKMDNQSKTTANSKKVGHIQKCLMRSSNRDVFNFEKFGQKLDLESNSYDVTQKNTPSLTSGESFQQRATMDNYKELIYEKKEVNRYFRNKDKSYDCSSENVGKSSSRSDGKAIVGKEGNIDSKQYQQKLKKTLIQAYLADDRAKPKLIS